VAKFLHSVAVQSETVSADGVQQYDLSVNPLSMVLIRLSPLNAGAAPTISPYLAIAAAMNTVKILHSGVAIVSMPGQDLAALAYFRHGCVPTQAQQPKTDNAVRSVVVPVFMGRHAYDPKSCFPATRRGELILEVDFDIASTGYDNLSVQIETVELLGAKPSEYERKTQSVGSFPATGINDIELPIGNRVRGLLAWGNTAFSGTAPAPTLGRMETLVDNESVGYSATDFETALMLHTLWGRQPPRFDLHTHAALDAGPYNVGSGGFENYCMLDFDPDQTDQYALDTASASRFRLRCTAETADAFRVTTVERVKV